MATDATGTPTSKGIPKYDPGADAPSGLGFNATMDAIDVLLDSYAQKPSGILAGEFMVWNGTAWVRSSVTRPSPSSLGSGSPSTATYLRGDGTWAGAGASLVTSLPGSPSDGDEVIFTDSLTAGTYHWRLKYVSGRASNKWVFIGGAPAINEVASSQGTSSTSYTDLSTAGPSFTLPVAGDYQISIGAYNTVTEADVTVTGYMSFAIGGTGASDSDAVIQSTPVQSGGPYGHSSSGARTLKKTGLTAVTLTAKYRCSQTTTTTFANRFMVVEPIAIGG